MQPQPCRCWSRCADKLRQRVGQDERLKVMVLQAVRSTLVATKTRLCGLLEDTLVLAEPGGFIRIFIDEGTAMCQLLSQASHSRDHAGLYR